MSERFIRRLMKWSGTEFHDDAEWAEREILRLRDRLAAVEAREDERDALRAELAASRQDHQRDVDQMRQDWASDTHRLRAELAAANAERDRVAAINVEHCSAVNTYIRISSQLEAERDELRVKLAERDELLRELAGYGCPVCGGDCSAANPPVALCPMTRIDALLKDGGGDEQGRFV